MIHGTRSSYVEGCHCPECTQANTDYQREWQKKDRRKKGMRPRKPVECGTASGYVQGCRCLRCRAAHSTHLIQWKRSKRGKPIPDWVVHSYTTYINWGCRCDICRADYSRYQREYHARKKNLTQERKASK